MNQEQLFAINEDIIKGLHRNDSRVMKQLFDLYYAPLCRFAARYVGDKAIAEEIAGDVMYKIWENRQAEYVVGTFREYLYTATRNTAINYLKQQERRRNLLDEWAEQLRYDLIEETPLDILTTEELQVRCDELINALPEQCRIAYQLSRSNDLTYEEIAEKMQISVNTVKYHIKTALSKIRAGLEGFIVWGCLVIHHFF